MIHVEPRQYESFNDGGIILGRKKGKIFVVSYSGNKVK
jgi:hypothetical protein